MKTKSKEKLPERVPFSAIPTGEIPSLFAHAGLTHMGLESKDIAQWAHRSVWTDRMLETLLQDRVKGGKWHALFDKIYSELNLSSASAKVLGKQGAAGVDRQTVSDFEKTELVELRNLQDELRQRSYRPSPVRRVWIPKPGSQEQRPLGIPTVRDRVVQTALVHVIEPILDQQFHARSFGFRRGRGCHHALRVVEEKLDAGYVYVVDADLQGYFDTIPKDRLLAMVGDLISDGRVMSLIESFLDQGIMEELQTWTPEAGVPQGAVLSPVLANLYLNPLDHQLSEAGYEMVRYADDFVILCRTLEEAESALAQVRCWVSAAGLTLHPDKTQIVDSRQTSFSFLGYSFRGKWIFPRSKSREKLVSKLRALTPRQSGQSLESTIVQINQVTRGWFGYYRHCNWRIFAELDKMIRRRLRRQLLKRHRLNPKRQCRTHRWQNVYFTRRGFWSLREAHFRFARSHPGTY